MGYTSIMANDLAPHIKDLITAASSMPPNARRLRMLEALKTAYLYASSDSLAPLTIKEASDGRN